MSDHNFLIHTNGSAAEDMRERFLAVSDAAEKLVEALLKVMPNMRDYYPLEGGAKLFMADALVLREHVAAATATDQWAGIGALRAMGVDVKVG
jgi:hypothetical protein